MKILVTGGCGFIGRHLCKELVKNNEVTVLDNFSNSTEKDIPENTVFINGDVRNIDDVKKASQGVDLVYHLAAKISVTESVEKPELYYDVNVNGTESVFEVNKNKKIIFINSASIYGDTEDLPVKETHPLNPKSPYAETKIAGEKIIVQNPENCVARLFNIYGEGQSKEYGGVISIFLKAAITDKPLTICGDGTQTRDYLHINDVVSALIFLQDKKGIYNLGSGKEISINQKVNIIKSIKRNIKIEHMPERDGDIYRSVADISKIKAAGWEPKVTMEKGITELFSFFF